MLAPVVTMCEPGDGASPAFGDTFRDTGCPPAASAPWRPPRGSPLDSGTRAAGDFADVANVRSSGLAGCTMLRPVTHDEAAGLLPGDAAATLDLADSAWRRAYLASGCAASLH